MAVGDVVWAQQVNQSKDGGLEKPVAAAGVSGLPDRLVIVGRELDSNIKPGTKLAPLWEAALTNAGWGGTT